MKRAGRNVCKCTVGLRRECGITSSGTKGTGGMGCGKERFSLIFWGNGVYSLSLPGLNGWIKVCILGITEHTPSLWVA